MSSSILTPSLLTRNIYRRAPHLYTVLRRGAISTSLSASSSPSSSHTTKKTLSHTPSSANFSTSRTMASSMNFLQACELRRTIYQLTDKIPISDDRVEELVRHAVLHVPSSFNSQSTRIVLLLNDEHKQFWEFVKEVLKPQVGEDRFPATEKKLDGFKAGHGTILFLVNPAPVNELAAKFATYAQHFPGWATQSNAMHQFHLWTALEAEGCGANLQHYNPIIDQKAKTHWNIPQDWNLEAQLVFGGLEDGVRESVGEKAQTKVEERLFVYGKKN